MARGNDFGGQVDVQFVPNLQSDIWLSPKNKEFNIPFLFHYYSHGKPYGLRVQIWDENKIYKSIEIRKITINYRNGDVVHRNEEWIRNLEPDNLHNSLIKTEMFMLSDTVDKLVLEHQDVEIVIEGNLIDIQGNKTSFSVIEKFEARSGFGITTFWDVIGNV